ncbi:hypothetical protein [Kitasatospora sp. NPDC057015]
MGWVIAVAGTPSAASARADAAGAAIRIRTGR